MSRTPEQLRKAVRTIYDRRRAAGLCVRDQRDTGGPEHAPPTRQRRRSDGGFDFCETCYADKIAATKAGRARRRRNRR